jgi:hypothetical protein
MKLQIVRNDNESIDGFVSLKVNEDFKTTLSQVIDHSCKEVLMLDILDTMEYDQSFELLVGVLQKIRLNGSITLRGISSISFAHSLLSGPIDSKQASGIISNIHSIHDQRDVINLLESNNFTIDTVRLSGVAYELKATRQTNVS